MGKAPYCESQGDRYWLHCTTIHYMHCFFYKFNVIFFCLLFSGKKVTNVEKSCKRLDTKYSDLQVDFESTWSDVKEGSAYTRKAVKEMESGFQVMLDEANKKQDMQAAVNQIMTDLEMTKQELRRQLDSNALRMQHQSNEMIIRQDAKEIVNHCLFFVFSFLYDVM